MLTILNLFFIPMIMLYLFYKLKQRELKLNAEFISLYMVSCSVVAVVTKLLLFVAKYLFSLLYTDVESAYYSFVAIIVAVLIPLVLKLFKIEIKDN